MQAGIQKIVALIRPTLGPLPHIVAIEPVSGLGRPPELLDSGGTIARRVIQLPDREEDVGAMYLRHVLWKLQEAEGDGTATAAVMFETIYNLGLRFVAAGGSAMLLRPHLESGLRLILGALDRQVTHLRGKQKLAGLARTICYDDALAKMLGEIFDIIGPYGRLEVRQGSGRELIREYVEGMYWDGGLRSRQMANAGYGLRADLENTAILLSDLEINDPEQLIPLLEMAVKNDVKQLVLISSALSEKALGLLLTPSNREKVNVVAVKAPGITNTDQQTALEDLAILTGGKPFYKTAGDTLRHVQPENLGRVRRAWADGEHFGITGPRGDPRQLRQHITALRAAYRAADNPLDSSPLLERLGKLTGGSAALMVGGLAPADIEARVELAKRTASAMRGAMQDGVVPGGGVALLQCRPALEQCLKNAEGVEERAAYRMLLEALETPFRTLMENAGFMPGKVLAEMEEKGPDFGFDVLNRAVVDMREAAIYDAAPVVKSAVRSAVEGAALALTTEAIVHLKNPPEQVQT